VNILLRVRNEKPQMAARILREQAMLLIEMALLPAHDPDPLLSNWALEFGERGISEMIAPVKETCRVPRFKLSRRPNASWMAS